MNTRPLGRTGLSIAPMVFGANVFGWTVDEPTAFRLLDRFVEARLNAIDTADVYSMWAPGNRGGESETIIGKWLAAAPERRDRVVLISKVGMPLAPEQRGLSHAHIVESVEASLERLRTDRIDLYLAHVPDPHTPVAETLRAFETLLRQGKVRAIGASNHSAVQLREALQTATDAGLPRYEVLQPEYNLYDRAGYEGDLSDLCAEEGLGVIAYRGLASGFLSGKYRSAADLDKSPRGQRACNYLDARGLRILAALDEVAREQHATPAEVALAWLVARPDVTAPIASATTLEQLDSLVRATRLPLSAAEIQRLDDASGAD